MNSRRRRALAAPVAVVAALLGGNPAAAQDWSPSAHWDGDVSYFLGAAVASGPCDVNGDGYDDVLAGAWGWSKTPAQAGPPRVPASGEGAAFVLLGGRGLGGDLAGAPSARWIEIDGGAPGDTAGWSVACAGDANGDGIDDLALGAYARRHPGRPQDGPTGSAYVVFGSRDFGSLDLGFLGDRGYRIDGGLLDGNLGFGVAGVGDLDDDGRDDLAVAAVVGDPLGRENAGQVHVVAGRAASTTVDLELPGAALMSIAGAAAQDRLGAAAPAGDVDGDGHDDLVLGSYTAEPLGPDTPVPGAAYVVSGATHGRVDLAELGDRGFTIVGPRARERLGVSVAGVGDQNGDGLADVLIGADGVSNAATGDREGAAYVVYGSRSRATVDTADLGARGHRIAGAAKDDKFGYSVAAPGDVNRDGRPDLLVGAYGADPAGAAYLIWGRPVPGTTEPVAGGGVRIAVGDGSRFGRQVAGVGDVDGNGVADVAVGDDLARPAGRQSAGRVTVVLAPDPPKPSAPPAPRPRPRPSDPPRPAAPRPAAKPHAVTVAARRLTARRGGRVRVTLRCAAGGAACTGTARLILGGRWSAPAGFALQPGERTTVTVRLRARMRRVLARRGRSRAVLRVATNVPGKPRATQRVNLVLRRAR